MSRKETLLEWLTVAGIFLVPWLLMWMVSVMTTPTPLNP